MPLLCDENETAERFAAEGECSSTLTALELLGVDELFSDIVFMGLLLGVSSSVSEKKFSVLVDVFVAPEISSPDGLPVLAEFTAAWKRVDVFRKKNH